MPNVTFNIANNDIDLLAKSLGYQTIVDGQPNPETAGVFTKNTVIDQMKERIRLQKERDAIAAANITDAVIT